MARNTLAANKVIAYREVARRLCAHQSTKTIARYLDKSVATIRKWLRAQEFQEILKEMDQTIWQSTMDALTTNASQSVLLRAEEDQNAAYDTLIELMGDAKSEGVRYKCASDILEIGGSKDRQSLNDQKAPPLTVVQINNFKQTVEQVHGRNDGEAARRVVEISPADDR